jgi:hypothetical protein
VQLNRHGARNFPVAYLALELLVVGYVAKFDLYEPHGYVAGRAARVLDFGSWIWHGLHRYSGGSATLSVADAWA